MRRLQCNQVSFILAGIVLQIIGPELYQGADCLELEKLKIHGIVEPFLNKIKKTDSGESSLSKIGKSLLTSLSEIAVEFLESIEKSKDNKVEQSDNGIKLDDVLSSKGNFLDSLTENIFTDSLKDSGTEVGYEKDDAGINELFFNSEDDTEPPAEEEITDGENENDSSPQKKCDCKSCIKYDPPKQSKKHNNSDAENCYESSKKHNNSDADNCCESSKKHHNSDADYYYEPFT